MANRYLGIDKEAGRKGIMTDISKIEYGQRAGDGAGHFKWYWVKAYDLNGDLFFYKQFANRLDALRAEPIEEGATGYRTYSPFDHKYNEARYGNLESE